MKLHEMTESEITASVFAGEPPYKPIGLRDKLTDDEILSLFDHPAFGDFSDGFKTWVWSAFDAILMEEHGDDPMGTHHGRNE